jgi:hypothetical protein
VFLDVEHPFGVKAFVEPLNHGTTFDVIEHVSIRAVPALDLLRRERSLKYFSIHKLSPFIVGIGYFFALVTGRHCPSFCVVKISGAWKYSRFAKGALF